MQARRHDIGGRFRQATRHHAAGRHAEAEQAYREVLAAAPDHADSLHGLGVLRLEQGRSDLAIGLIGKAMQHRPRQAHFHLSLGRALLERGHLEEARAAFQVATLLNPHDPVGHFDLGLALERLGRADAALASQEAALRLDPFFAASCRQAGLLLYAAGRPAEAAARFRQLAGLCPDDAAAHGLQGVMLRTLGDLAACEAPLRHAMRLDPGNADWRNLLGATLLDLARADEAAAPLQDATRLAPDHADAHNNLGLALLALDRPADAVAALRTAALLQPGQPDIASNLGRALREAGDPVGAEDTWREVLAQTPDHAPAAFNLATARLAAGDFAAGWPGFEARLRVPDARPRHADAPRWDGAPLPGGTVLIHAEQGFGDTIQFCRFVAQAAQRARIVLEVPAPLARLLDGLPGAAAIIPRGTALPPFDAQCPLLSLPHLLGTTLATIPAAFPYVQAPAGEAWATRLAALPGLRVGLCWAGSRGYSHDRWRSLPPDALAPLALPGLSLVSLQKDAPEVPPLPLHDWTNELHDFADTAALIAGLDLVISVDTAVAHLAGALGRPVWLLNRFDADWRWLQDRDDSPWYPTLRQFRQPAPGDWARVIARVAAALHDLLHR